MILIVAGLVLAGYVPGEIPAFLLERKHNENMDFTCGDIYRRLFGLGVIRPIKDVRTADGRKVDLPD